MIELEGIRVIAAGVAVGILVVAVASTASQYLGPKYRAWRDEKKAFSYLIKDGNGTVYVEDPETKTMHRLDKVLEERLLEQLRVKRPNMTPRQERKVRQQVRRQIAERNAAV